MTLELELEVYQPPSPVLLRKRTTGPQVIHLTDDAQRTLCGLRPKVTLLPVSDMVICSCRRITTAAAHVGYRLCVKCLQAEVGVPRLKRVVGT